MLAERGIDHDSAVIPYGVDVPAQTATYRSSPFRVVYSGRMVETQKRLSLVTAALIRSCQINPDICVKIIGDGPSLATSRKAVTDSGLTSRIIFTGRLAPMQVKRELFDAQAILLMSDFEGLPVALLEGMAAGVVPVVRNIPSGIPELVHHERTGLLVDGQPELAAQALSRLAHDPTLWQSCSVAARQLVSECYSEDVCYQRWRKLIDKLSFTSTARYPLVIPDLLELPVHDPRLGAGYPIPKVWYLKVASRLKRGVCDLGRTLGQRS
jgi:glycosyltransferase involved in cell wall biosynthesis